MTFRRWLFEPRHSYWWYLMPPLLFVFIYTGQRVMGVLECGREGCDRVMCDQYIDQTYVCDDCLEEFQHRFGHEEHDDEAWLVIFHNFMETERPSHTGGSSLDQFLEWHMKKR